MIIKNGTNQKIEKHKAKLGLTGDVYVINGHYIENLQSHKVLIPNSTATTLEEAELERIELLEQERLAREEAERLEQERLAQETEKGEINEK